MIAAKIVLYMTILITSSLIGFAYGGRFSRRVISLGQLQQGIRLLQTEIIVFANPLPDALENISIKVSKEIKDVFIMIKEEMLTNQSGDLYFSFLEASEYLKTTCLLKQKDIDVFLSLGKVIGKTNRVDQEQQFLYALSQLEELLDEAKEEKIKNEKMYRSLGVLMGLGMIIILI